MNWKIAAQFAFPDESVPDSVIVESLGLKSPEGIGVTLKAPQLLARYFGSQAPKFILSYDKAMGKTLTYMLVAEDSGLDKIVVLCTKNAMSAQRKALRKHLPWQLNNFTFVMGTRDQRIKQWAKPVKYYFCTYATFLADMGRRQKSGDRILPAWAENAFFICDEYHRVLRNRKSGANKPNATFEALKALNPPRLILSSGSVANKGPHSMWAALHLCDRKFFSSYWNFVKAYCIVEDTPFGKQIVGVRNIAAFRRVVAPYVIHRKKDLKDYPPKTRQAIDVEMEPWQKKLHDQLKNQLMAEIEDQNGSTTLIVAMNTLSAAIKLRQLLTCPKILDPSLGWGIGLETILEDMQESELSHYVLSTKWRSALPYLAEFFSTNGIRAEMLHGGLGPDEVDERINRWTKNGGLMMQTIDFAESYELAAAHVMYFLGADYDAERNSQAEDRINRDIRVTPHPSDYYYIRHVDSLEADLFDEMALAADMVHNLMNRPLSQVHTLFGG